MKLLTLCLAATTASLCAFCGVRPVYLTDGNNRLTEYAIPSRSAKLLAYETMMIHTNSGESTSLAIKRTVKTVIPHTDIITTVITSQVEIADTLVNNYYVGAIYAQQEGYDDLVHNVVFSNHYSNSTKSKYVGPDGNIFSRINLKVNNGAKTTEQPTNFFIQVTFGDTVNFYTNFIWNISEGNLTMHERANNPALTVRLYRDEYSMKYTTTNIVDSTTVTNNWNEGVTRSISNPVASSVTTNGYAYSTIPDPCYVFAGESLYVSSPCATNNPGEVRVLISE